MTTQIEEARKLVADAEKLLAEANANASGYFTDHTDEFKAVCKDLNRAHDHIKLYVEDQDKQREVIKALVAALEEVVRIGDLPVRKIIWSAADTKCRSALALGKKAVGA